MRINWKLLAGFSLFGGGISLISGIAGGNPFGIILLRLALSAIVFGALGLGVQSVLRRYLPDLLQPASRPERASGDTVDIIIDEEVPVTTVSETEGGAAEPGDSPGLVESGGAQEVLDESDRPPPVSEGMSARADEDLDSPARPEEPGGGSQRVPEAAPVEFPEFEGDEAEPELFGQEAGDPALRSTDAGSVRPEVELAPAAQEEAADLEVLPEIEGVDEGDASGPFEQPVDGGSGDADQPVRRTPSTPREMRQAQIEETVKDQDPETLARAVRTFLKKDQ